MSDEGDHFKAIHTGPLESLRQRASLNARGKYLLGAELGLNGCEVSLNRLPAGKWMPFVHAHKQNEEVYIVIRGNGAFHVDGNEFPIGEGSVIRVDPPGKRAWKAGDEDLYFICIQAKAGSLGQATLEDGIRLEARASWMAE
jgi:mannose-6-phosphate isomerase-like protein (cupin superfamily)